MCLQKVGLCQGVPVHYDKSQFCYTAMLNTSVLKGEDIGCVSLPFLAMSSWDTFILNNTLSDAGLLLLCQQRKE